jgi:hypothetical protein
MILKASGLAWGIDRQRFDLRKTLTLQREFESIAALRPKEGGIGLCWQTDCAIGLLLGC